MAQNNNNLDFLDKMYSEEDRHEPKISKAWCVGLGVVCVAVVAMLIVGGIGAALLGGVLLAKA